MLNFANAFLAVSREEIAQVVFSNDHVCLSNLLNGCKVSSKDSTSIGHTQLLGAILNYAAIRAKNGEITPDFADDIIAKLAKYIEIHGFIENLLLLNRNYQTIPKISQKTQYLLMKNKIESQDIENLFCLSAQDFMNFMKYAQNKQILKMLNYPIITYVRNHKLLTEDQIFYSMMSALYEKGTREDMAKLAMLVGGTK